jgi:hypothetical protein
MASNIWRASVFPVTVSEMFESANLLPSGPVQWMTAIRESSKGVYVIARTSEPHLGCTSCALPLCDPLPVGLKIDSDYENERWLPDEPIVYVGKSDQPISRRINQFYQHQCGNRSPHAGGQIILLLRCQLWLYWSGSPHPLTSERKMLSAFKSVAGQPPFANFDGKRRPRRIGRLP